MSIDEQINKIIDTLIHVACDYEQGEDVDLDAKANESYHAIKALIAQESTKARIDELGQALEAGDGISWDEQMAGTCGHIARRIAELQKELDDNVK